MRAPPVTPRPARRRRCTACGSPASPAGPAATVAAGHRLAHDDVDEPLRHDDDLDDVLAVDVRADVVGTEAQRLELLARCPGWRLDAVAHLAVDLAHELVGVALEEALVGGRPRLLPHAPAGQALVGV